MNVLKQGVKKEKKMKRKFIFSLCAVAFLSLMLVLVYNHFKLYRFKDLSLAEFKTVLALRNEKCAFHPMQMGGGFKLLHCSRWWGIE